MSVNTQQSEDMGYHNSNHRSNHIGSRHGHSSSHRTDTEISVSDSGSREWNPQDGKMSPERRTFCLFTMFDLILTFILWVIYTQLIGNSPIWKAFKDQVFNYTFQKSLFDTVMISACRFTFIMLAYALFRISHWWVIAITTSMTCVYLLFKCFLFEFNDQLLGGKNPLSYIVLIVCFILAWIETWMLDFKVIPIEHKIRSRSIRNTERSPLLGDNSSRTNSLEESRDPEYYSPYHTPQGSDDETENQLYQSVHSSRSHSRKELENYGKLLDDAKVVFLEMLDMDGWKQESGKSLEEGLVFSQYMKKYGRKLFKLQGIIHMKPKDLWEDMIIGLNDSPAWNPTILESRTLHVIDDHSEVTYNIAAEAAGGLVSSRDFINCRRWLENGQDKYISYGVGCTFHDMPVQKKHVRGDNGPGGWAFDPVDQEPDQCLFTWIVNSNLKGWLPQAVIDQAMSGVLVTYYKLLREHYEELINQRREIM